MDHHDPMIRVSTIKGKRPSHHQSQHPVSRVRSTRAVTIASRTLYFSCLCPIAEYRPVRLAKEAEGGAPGSVRPDPDGVDEGFDQGRCRVLAGERSGGISSANPAGPRDVSRPKWAV